VGRRRVFDDKVPTPADMGDSRKLLKAVEIVGRCFLILLCIGNGETKDKL
jgi:hypothetical protein